MGAAVQTDIIRLQFVLFVYLQNVLKPAFGRNIQRLETLQQVRCV